MNSSTSVIGVDLAGVETRPTGICVLKNLKAKTFLACNDDEILTAIDEIEPQLVAVDAPLSLPKGRKTIEERTSIHLRECDKELLRRGIRFFPVTLGPMRKLTSRGIELRRILERKHLKVIEVYPGGAQDILGIPRKQKGLGNLRNGLKQLKIEGLTDGMSDHELDAVTCAYVGKLFLEGKTETYGTPRQAIIMPNGKVFSSKKRVS
jgi:predicted nuclease with RNAse H fold